MLLPLKCLFTWNGYLNKKYVCSLWIWPSIRQFIITGMINFGYDTNYA